MSMAQKDSGVQGDILSDGPENVCFSKAVTKLSCWERWRNRRPSGPQVSETTSLLGEVTSQTSVDSNHSKHRIMACA